MSVITNGLNKINNSSDTQNDSNQSPCDNCRIGLRFVV